MKFTEEEKIYIRDMPFYNVPTWKFANRAELAVRQDEPIPVVHKRILWKRNNQIMTPVVIRITSRVLSRLEISESVKLSRRWKFEDELGDAPLLDPARPDWREPVRVLFETEWRRSTPKEKKTAG